jgi:putative ABC transport system substrate-binding protein
LIGASAALAVRPGLAQQQKRIRRIGILHIADFAAPERGWKVIMASLARAGYKEGDNLVVERRHAGGKLELLPTLAEELVGLKVELILTTFNEVTSAAQRATRTIPIVMLLGSYPVQNGFIQSQARPGGNITGLDTWPAATLTEKRYQLLKLAVPNAKVVADLWGETTSGAGRALGADFGERIAAQIGLSIISVQITPGRPIAKALDDIAGLRPDVLAIEGSPATVPHFREIATFAVTHKLVSIGPADFFVMQGGLFSYGPDLLSHYDRAGSFVDRILRGANPADIPVEQPTKYELVLNKKTAAAIGVTLSPSFLNRVDRIVE